MKYINPLVPESLMSNHIMYHPILGKIYDYIQPIKFDTIKRLDLEKSGERTLDGNGKELSIRVSPKEKVVYSVKVINETARVVGHDIIIIDGMPYFYNGCYWEALESNIFSALLSQCGLKANMLTVEAEDHKIQKYFIDQMLTYAARPPIKKGTHVINITLNNGTIKFVENEPVLCSFDKEDYQTYQLTYSYDPKATCPQFDAFLNDALPEKDAQDLLLEMIGYCFVPTKYLKLETALILYGPTGTGKSVTHDVVKMIVGQERVGGYTTDEFCNDPNVRAQLRGLLLNYTTEFGEKFSSEMYKKLISGEDVKIKTLYKDVETMRDYNVKFMFNSNSLPKMNDAGGAMSRRTPIVGFLKQIEKSKMDKQLSKKLGTELPGIFNRVLEGIKRLLINETFTDSDFALEMAERHKFESDSTFQFFQERGLVPSVKKPERQNDRLSNDYEHTSTKDLFAFYLEYCKQMDCGHTSYQNFLNKLREHFHVQPGNGNKTIVFCKTDEDKNSEFIRNPFGEKKKQ